MRLAALVLIAGLAALLFTSVTHQRADAAAIERCAADTRPLKCYEAIILERISTGTLSDGFELLRSIYGASPQMRARCFGFGRDLTNEIYRLYPDPASLRLTPVTAICNFTLFQHYPAALLSATKDLGRARAFCETVSRDIGEDVPGAFAECYRGIGRGLPSLTSDEDLTARDTAIKGISLCKEITPDPESLNTCLSGLFITLQSQTPAPQSGLTDGSVTPLGLCDTFDDARVIALCRGNFKRGIMPRSVGTSTYEEILGDIEATHGKLGTEGADSVISTLAYDRAIADFARGGSYPDAIRACLELPGELITPCLTGYSMGLVKNATPGEQHEAALGFCKAIRDDFPSLPDNTCPHSQLVSYISGIYPEKTYARICDRIRADFGVTCESLVSGIRW